MRCPKCQYISFDSGGRCRNCGYDFSLAADAEATDLPIQNGTEPIGPLSDLALQSATALEQDFSSESDARAATPRPITSSFDLPLFRDRASKADPPVVPRGPLAVRRPTIGAAAPKPRPRRSAAVAAALEDPEPRLALGTAEMPVVPERSTTPDRDGVPAAAGIGARLLGGLIDLAIVGGIDLTVWYFTLKICELTFAETASLPLAPFIAFLLLLNGGYFATFVAAGGQTIGKMAAGTRVIPADPGAGQSERVPFGHAVVRAVGYLVSALPAGLGFLPALIGAERRTLHDRLADTRVVKA